MSNFTEVKGRFVSDVLRKKIRKTRPTASFVGETWQFSLGMHNFRTALRNGDSKSRCAKVGKRDKCVGVTKTSIKGSNNLLSRWDLSYGNGVRKSIKADEMLFEMTCAVVRRWAVIRWNGRDRRFLATQKKILSSEREAARLKALSVPYDRASKRRNFFYLKTYLKLPKAYLENVGLKGFKRFRALVGRVGAKSAFHMSNSWKSTDGIRIKRIFDQKRATIEKIARDLEKEGKRAPKPERKDYKNFKGWSTAIHIWQIPQMVCQPCYKKAYKLSFDEDKTMWKGDRRYGFGYKGRLCDVCKDLIST